MGGSKPTVELVFAGDEQKLTRAMNNVGKAARKLDDDVGSSRSGIDGANGSAQKLSGGLDKLKGVAIVAGAAIGAALIAGGKQAIDAASEQQQAMGGLDAVFKENSATVKQWAADAAESVGLSRTAYASLAAPLGAALKGAGLSLNEATDKTKVLITAGADLAATFGGTTSDAVSAMGSALRGEFDPMERYGVAMSAAKVQAKALEMGLVKTGAEMSAEAKMAATLALIMEGSADATGQFAREADTAAGKTERQKAKVENLKAQLGEKLLPVYGKVIDSTIKLTDWMAQNEGKTKAFAIVAGGILVLAFTAWAVSAGAAAVATLAATWPILAVILAIGLLVAGIWMLAKNWGAVWGWIQGVAGSVADWVVGKWQWLMGWFSGVPGWFANIGSAIGNGIKGGFLAAINWIVDKLNWLAAQANRIPGVNLPMINYAGGGGTASGGGGGRRVMHTGGVVPGVPGQEVLAVLQAGERVTARGQSAGGTTVTFAGDTSSAFATAFMELVRTGQIQIGEA